MEFPNGLKTSEIGQGTWKMGSDPKSYSDHLEAIQTGVRHGLTLIDTAEMYGQGDSELLVGEAIKDFSRHDLFLVSKVLPHNANKKQMEKALDASLKRMGIDELDLYLLHWGTSTPLEKVVESFELLVKKGKIKGWGVSNFDLEDMQALLSVENGHKVQTNQVLYNLGSRGVDYALLPYLKEQGIPMMAYTPIVGNVPAKKKEMMENQVLKDIAERHNLSLTQILLSWVSHQENVIPIPKASKKQHTLENASILNAQLSSSELLAIDKAFPAPSHRIPLDIE